jgi:ABC-type phosphate/phosphonate transport system permease subunit
VLDWLILMALLLTLVGALLGIVGIVFLAGAVHGAATAPRRVRQILRRHCAAVRAELDAAEAAAKAVRR